MSWAKAWPASSAATLPTNAPFPPKLANPAIVLAADRPKRSSSRPSHHKVIAPALRRPVASQPLRSRALMRKSSSTGAITSTIALPRPRTSKWMRGHGISFEILDPPHARTTLYGQALSSTRQTSAQSDIKRARSAMRPRRLLHAKNDGAKRRRTKPLRRVATKHASSPGASVTLRIALAGDDQHDFRASPAARQRRLQAPDAPAPESGHADRSRRRHPPCRKTNAFSAGDPGARAA